MSGIHGSSVPQHTQPIHLCGQRHAFASLDIKVCLCGPGTTLSQNEAAYTAGPCNPISGGKDAACLWMG